MTVIQSKKLRDSARGEQCTVNISGVCCYDESTVILAHLPSSIAGYKSTDLSSCYACHTCHTAIDQIGSVSEFEESRDWYLRRAMVRTWTRFYDMGLITVKGA